MIHREMIVDTNLGEKAASRLQEPEPRAHRGRKNLGINMLKHVDRENHVERLGGVIRKTAGAALIGHSKDFISFVEIPGFRRGGAVVGLR
jgi:hypothetical protein